MKISVVIIGYNIENYICRCLDSVVRQNYKDYEVIFVNDGSTDRTMEIARDYQDRFERPKLVDKKNGGIVSARKAGVRNAEGEYVLFIDGDDYVNDDMLMNFARAEAEHSGYDIIISDHFEQRPSGKTLERKSSVPYGELKDDEFIKGILDGNLNHFMVNKLYRKDFLLQADYLRYPNITIAEDLLSNSVFGTYQPKVFYAEMTNYYYQFNESGVSRNGGKNIVDQQIRAIRLLSKEIQRRTGDRYKEYLDYQWYLFAFGYLQTGYSHEFKKYLVSRCEKQIRRVRENEIYKKQMFNLSVLYGRTMIVIYMYFPFFSRVFNFGIRCLIRFLQKHRILNDY